MQDHRNDQNHLENIHRIAVLSDTHGLLRPEVIRVVKTCGAVLHAGDVRTPQVLHTLRGLAPVFAVRGNVDRDAALIKELPQECHVTLGGIRFYLVHDKKEIPSEPKETDVVICGHSHRYEEAEGPVRRLNPGSCGPRRFRLPVTMMVLTLHEDGHIFTLQRIDLLSGKERQEPDPGNLPTDRELDRLIRSVVRQVNAGRTVAQIAARTRAPEELVADICRIYVTHPGVDIDGILDRMERKNL